MTEFLESGTSLWVALAVSVLLFLLFLRAWFNLRAIPVLQPPQGMRAADCMVVIPARDEEDVIGRAVRSLPHDTVIVVDDGSSDATA